MESVQHWLNITLIQNENHLYELRRKCVEFISAATANVNKSDIVSYLYVRALQEITQSYGFSDFRTIIPLILADLQPHIILDSTRILSEHGYSEPVQKALAFIRKFYAAPISVSEISSESFVTRKHLTATGKCTNPPSKPPTALYASKSNPSGSARDPFSKDWKK